LEADVVLAEVANFVSENACELARIHEGEETGGKGEGAEVIVSGGECVGEGGGDNEEGDGRETSAGGENVDELEEFGGLVRVKGESAECFEGGKGLLGGARSNDHNKHCGDEDAQESHEEPSADEDEEGLGGDDNCGGELVLETAGEPSGGGDGSGEHGGGPLEGAGGREGEEQGRGSAGAEAREES
jgi:hypothetical protein